MKRTDLDKIVYRAIEDNEDGLLFSQLLEVTKISKGSLNKPLDRLEDEGVIEQDIITKRYILKK